MPGVDGDSERAIADGIEGLGGLHDREVPNAIDKVVDQVRGDLTRVRRMVEESRRLGDDVSAAVSSAADELDTSRPWRVVRTGATHGTDHGGRPQP